MFRAIVDNNRNVRNWKGLLRDRDSEAPREAHYSQKESDKKVPNDHWNGSTQSCKDKNKFEKTIVRGDVQMVCLVHGPWQHR